MSKRYAVKLVGFTTHVTAENEEEAELEAKRLEDYFYADEVCELPEGKCVVRVEVGGTYVFDRKEGEDPEYTAKMLFANDLTPTYVADNLIVNRYDEEEN